MVIQDIFIGFFILFTLCFIIQCFRHRNDLSFEELYKIYKPKLRLERYDDNGNYLCFSLGSMLLTEAQTYWLLQMVHSRKTKGSKEKIQMRVKERNGKWRPEIKFGSFGKFGSITINYYGDLDDTNALVEYDSQAEAEAYVQKVTKANKVSDSNSRIFYFQSEGNEGKPFIN